ncbi:hypothetical protein LINGRAPRIM_LOCUS2091 [Linum grandiflorum]
MPLRPAHSLNLFPTHPLLLNSSSKLLHPPPQALLIPNSRHLLPFLRQNNRRQLDHRQLQRRTPFHSSSIPFPPLPFLEKQRKPRAP